MTTPPLHFLLLGFYGQLPLSDAKIQAEDYPGGVIDYYPGDIF